MLPKQVCQVSIFRIFRFLIHSTAVRHMASSLGVEWGKDNIRVNVLSPGYMRTKLTDDVLSMDTVCSHLSANTHGGTDFAGPECAPLLFIYLQ